MEIPLPRDALRHWCEDIKGVVGPERGDGSFWELDLLTVFKIGFWSVG